MVQKLALRGLEPVKSQDEVTEEMFRLIKGQFPHVPDEIEKVVYRVPSGFIHARIIDPFFEGTDCETREDLVADIFANLPEGTLSKTTLLMLYSPREAKRVFDYMMPAFDEPFRKEY